MFVYFGLGNPGAEYQLSRHNAGYLAVDVLAEILSQQHNQTQSNWKTQTKFSAKILKFKDVLLVKPETFMNNSGQTVRKVIDYYNLTTNQISVIHDDLDLKFGQIKTEFARGPKVHNGVNSVISHLGTEQFQRVRIGIDNRTEHQRQHLSGADYVLLPMHQQELDHLQASLTRWARNLTASLWAE